MGLEASLARSRGTLKIFFDAWNPKRVGSASTAIQNAGRREIPIARGGSLTETHFIALFGISRQPSMRHVEGAKQQGSLVSTLLELANVC